MKIDLLKNVSASDKRFFEMFDSFGSICKSKFIREPLSEYDILDLQENFLSNGVHCITVEDVKSGRELVSRFLNSLHCYHENAVLSVSSDAVNLCSNNEIIFTDIYYDLMQGGYISENKSEIKKNNFSDFFIDQFYYDFLLIEACQELVDNNWFLNFFTAMKSNNIDQYMPILLVTYSK